jgi:nucleotide-binding universal stress UspA family protein
VGHVLCHKSEELAAVALVMASHNRGRMRELLIGSVTNYCTHNSKVPVVVIR